MSSVIVHGSPLSPRVRAVLVTLIEKNAAWTLPDFDFTKMQSEDYRAIHPFARMPAVEHDGFVIYETQAITRYIDQTFAGSALHPSDPRAVARMNQTLGVIDCYAVPAFTPIMVNRVAGPLMGMPVNEAEITEALPIARRCLSALDRLHTGTEFFVGDCVSLADVNLAPVLSILSITPEGHTLLSEQGRLSAWLTAFEARDSMKQTQVPAEVIGAVKNFAGRQS